MFRSAATDLVTVPTEPPPDQPPGPGGIASEWRTVLQVPRLLAATPRLATAPRGHEPVVLVPGWTSPEATMAPLRAWLGWLGHDARHWGLGVNRGDPRGDAARLAPLVAAMAAAGGRRVTLVGWSLGGTVAREVARAHPDTVRQVVTYGTPAFGGPVHTVAASQWTSAQRDRISAQVRDADLADPIQVPITAILTRRDHVVAWQAQVDRTSPHVRHVEVDSTHFSMFIDPDVWLTVAAALRP